MQKIELVGVLKRFDKNSISVEIHSFKKHQVFEVDIPLDLYKKCILLDVESCIGLKAAFYNDKKTTKIKALDIFPVFSVRRNDSEIYVIEGID